jgi:hypothetical protein
MKATLAHHTPSSHSISRQAISRLSTHYAAKPRTLLNLVIV